VEFSTAPARLFREQGYQTHFIYGGNPGWRSIDKFIPRQGFEKLHGESQIKNKFPAVMESNLLHDWGVYDRYVFEYASMILREAQQPQFLFILTTSNHPPYTVPSDYQAPPLEFSETLNQKLIGNLQLNQDRLRAYQYANDQLGLFLNQMSKNSLDQRTIVAATGDHSFYIRAYDNLELMEKWSVPLYLQIPEAYRPHPLKPLSMGSHIDLFPTLYQLALSEASYLSVGQDLLDPNYEPWSFHTPSSSSLNEQAGVILSPKGEWIATLCRSSEQKYQSCPPTEIHQRLRNKLRSLMGTADYLFEYERQKGNKTP
jgi:phosphoglycerol transferase MdoB-like AlkP superfamily enzyme